MKYAVLQNYFGNGKVSAVMKLVPDDTTETQETRKGYDFYRDVFNNEDEAREFLKNCK